eukprot:TRINITY_DN98537_c0_g1_i1.p1 TRINITY_DN98537_c0_g1~~TRINITY_DN98537_c0_g1_i1.p1  ORF type:complete len:278 (+),score=29.63 TRINITY_DN98537_c0_g1_i1:92-925(+)
MIGGSAIKATRPLHVDPVMGVMGRGLQNPAQPQQTRNHLGLPRHEIPAKGAHRSPTTGEVEQIIKYLGGLQRGDRLTELSRLSKQERAMIKNYAVVVAAQQQIHSQGQERPDLGMPSTPSPPKTPPTRRRPQSANYSGRRPVAAGSVREQATKPQMQPQYQTKQKPTRPTRPKSAPLGGARRPSYSTATAPWFPAKHLRPSGPLLQYYPTDVVSKTTYQSENTQTWYPIAGGDWKPYDPAKGDSKVEAIMENQEGWAVLRSARKWNADARESAIILA